jgi:release factor glutamine methyltransferase
MEADAGVVLRLRAAGCVWAEDEAALLAGAARSPAELDALVERRAGGEPLEQVLGWAEFNGLRIIVDPGVFVPRRRSEFLVAVAGAVVNGPVVNGPVAGGSVVDGDVATPPGALLILDLCCGTGALGLGVAHELGGRELDGRGWAGGGARGVELYAADLDPAAVACARRNVEPAGGHVFASDLFAAVPEALRGGVGVLICNAPYVPTTEIAFMPVEARDHEARVALDGGEDGLAVLRRVAAQAPAWLAPGGVLLVETSTRQAPEMAAAMSAAGLRSLVHTDDEYGATVISGERL